MEDKYIITLIGETRLDTMTATEEQAINFFNSSGYSLSEAKRNLIPSFVVQEIK